MSGGAADRNDSLQNPTGTLGQGPDPDGQKNSAPGLQEQSAVPGKGGGVLSSEREPELSADDCTFHSAHAGHDYPFLWRLVSDAGNRSAAVHGVHFFHFQFLPGFTEGTFSKALAADIPFSTVPYGAGNWPYVDEHACRD